MTGKGEFRETGKGVETCGNWVGGTQGLSCGGRLGKRKSSFYLLGDRTVIEALNKAGDLKGRLCI